VGSGTSLEYCELSDIGRRRANNQDACVVVPPWNDDQERRRGWIFVVADGMGAHAAGEMASDLAVRHVPTGYEKLAATSPPRALKAAIRQANAEIHARGESAADLRGMGTTCTAMVLLPRGVLVGQVGDSRAYRVRGGLIEQLTRDHSLAWEVESARRQAGAEALPSPPKNIITRSLGPHARIEVDIEGPFPVEADDTYVLCTDGLSGQVADEEIGLVAASLSAAEAAAALVGLALVRGAPDNVTLVVLKTNAAHATDASAGGQPWPLTDDQERGRSPQPVPWRFLAVAAAALMAGLMFNPLALMKADGPLGGLLGGPLAEAVGWTLTVGASLLFLGASTAAFVAFLGPGGPERRVLRVGERLGSGPYRSYPCAASPDLVEGIAASVEAAADGLSDGERRQALGHVAACRHAIGTGDFTTAVAEAVRGIGVYRQSVETARSDDTIRTPRE